MIPALKEYKISSHPVVVSTFQLSNNTLQNRVINECEEILSTVLRWERGEISAIHSRETNREHILGMLDLVWEFREALSNICDIEELIIMILVHDLGEYRIGDISKSEKGVEKKKQIQKKHEKKVATILIKKIENTELREKCLRLLDRYFEFGIHEDQRIKDFDRLYLITKFLDTVQGVEHGLETVFKENLERQEIDTEKSFLQRKTRVIEHIQSNLQEISNICIFLDAHIILGAKNGYESLEGDEREEQKKQQKKQVTKQTTNGIYSITNIISARIQEKIKTTYNLEVEEELDGMIEHFGEFRDKYKN